MADTSNKDYFFLHFDPVCRVSVFSNGVEDIPLHQFFLSSLYLFDSFFQGQLGLVSCIIVMEEFVSLALVAVEGRKTFSYSYHNNGC